MKKHYEDPEMLIRLIRFEDVLTTSGNNSEGYNEEDDPFGDD
ncbi:MAG: hypothetical protein ACOYJY_05700 [Acutalibacteraceae bacterium]